MDSTMNAKNWSEIKSKIKLKWNKIHDDEIETVKSDLSKLVAKVQSVYGIAKEQAESQFEDFKTSIQSLLESKEPAKAKAQAV